MHSRTCLVYVQQVNYPAADSPSSVAMNVYRDDATKLFRCYYCDFTTQNSDTMRVSRFILYLLYVHPITLQGHGEKCTQSLVSSEFLLFAP